MKSPCRAGFSLLEVLVATAILLGSAVVLFELAAIGTEHARSAEELAEAQWVCQAKLNEILSGLTPLQTVQDEPLEDQPGWAYSVEIEPIDEPGLPADLAVLRVTVSEEVEEDQPGMQFSLTRWIRDPHLEADTESGGGGSADDVSEQLFEESGF